MAIETYYAILKIDGTLKTRARTKAASLFKSETEATRQAKVDGDTVVRLQHNTDSQPVFIRGLTLTPGE